MKRNHVFSFVGLTIWLLGVPLKAEPAGLFVKMATGYDMNHSAIWEDSQMVAKSDVPVYGADYFAKGDSGGSLLYGIHAGIHPMKYLDVSLGVEYRPDTEFNGQVNYPNAGNHQPVYSKTRTISLVFRTHIYPFRSKKNTQTINPFFGVHAGIAFHDTNSVRMHFPELRIPHTFVTPRGNNTAFIYGVSLGNSFIITQKIALGFELNYSFLGDAVTDAGNAEIVREGKSSIISVSGTRSSLKNAGIRIILKYFL